MKIWANTIVYNEENFIWFSLMSVIEFVDKIIVWDTGSTDKTVEIIKKVQEVFKDKIIFKQVGKVSKQEFPKLRQKMLEESNCDWILVLDGDEVWWEESIQNIIQQINKRGKSIEGIVVPFFVAVGDIYHLQEEQAGQYQLLNKKGHLSLKAINKKIPGLHVDWPYGKESYLDEKNQAIQNREKMVFIDAPFFHLTHLKRSSYLREGDKFKHEIGDKAPKAFKYPQVFYKSYPEIVFSPWAKLPLQKYLVAKILTPLRKIKRRLK